MPVTPESNVSITNTPTVFSRKPSGAMRAYGFGVNLCDRSTWYSLALQVVAEAVATGDGVTVTFSLDHGNGAVAGERILDLYHGKVADEDNLAALKDPAGDVHAGYYHSLPSTESVSGYKAIVKVTGAEKVERKYGAASGGDYTLDYTAGTITFATAPADGAAISATYWYVPSTYSGQALIRLEPPVGKKWIVNKVEVQYSVDVDLKDTTFVGVFDSEGSELARKTKLKNVRDIISWTNGSFPVVPAHGGSARGLTQGTIIQRWDYESAVELYNLGAAAPGVPKSLRVSLNEGVASGGEWMSVVFYGLEEALS